MTSHTENSVLWDDQTSSRYGPLTSTEGNSSDMEASAIEGRQRTLRDRGISTSSSTGDMRPHRSSVSVHFDALRHVGNANSIENFARSWQRAAGFFEVAPQAPSLVHSADDRDESPVSRSDRRKRAASLSSSLCPHSSSQEAEPSGEAVVDRHLNDQDPTPAEDPAQKTSSRVGNGSDEIFATAPHLASPFAANYGTRYGSLTSRATNRSMAYAGELWQRQLETGAQAPDSEREPLLVKQVEHEDGKVVNVVIGQSTLPQTIFNSANVLIGVGLLSLPLAVRYAGWVIGLSFLSFSAVVTSYTASILAKCLDVDDTLITFADIAYVSFGQSARVITSILFGLDLLGVSVALVVLFADSLTALVPGWNPMDWKLLCAVALIPLSFLPLWILSFSSVLGILCCLGIVAIICIDGLIKPHAPGSLREPAKTYLFPPDWSMLPIAIGLLMSPWGGHSVFPNIYRDMRHPQKFRKGLTITYIFTFVLDLAMVLVGLLMFGDDVKNEISSNILEMSAYPRALSVCIVGFIAIIPLTKIPLNARPIYSTIEVLAGLDARAVSNSRALIGHTALARGTMRSAIRIITILTFVGIAIIFPSFDRIMALLGSALCFTVCIILPLVFHLRIFGRGISFSERLLNYFLILVSSLLAILGTVWALLPTDVIRRISIRH